VLLSTLKYKQQRTITVQLNNAYMIHLWTEVQYSMSCKNAFVFQELAFLTSFYFFVLKSSVQLSQCVIENANHRCWTRFHGCYLKACWITEDKLVVQYFYFAIGNTTCFWERLILLYSCLKCCLTVDLLVKQTNSSFFFVILNILIVYIYSFI